MISGPDAGRIGRALKSVQGWVAETVVVVNNDVTDGTDKIASQHGARVFRETWKEHIAQKNSAAEKALQPWILGLDSDEEISSKLKSSIHRFFLSPHRKRQILRPNPSVQQHSNQPIQRSINKSL